MVSTTIDEFRINLQKFQFASKIKSCKNLIKLHKEKEQEYRETNNHHMIRYCKKKRKAYESDLKYYEGELQKLA